MNFNTGDWVNTINVRDFIQRNYSSYAGDASFLVKATPRTSNLWGKCAMLLAAERQAGGATGH